MSPQLTLGCTWSLQLCSEGLRTVPDIPDGRTGCLIAAAFPNEPFLCSWSSLLKRRS